MGSPWKALSDDNRREMLLLLKKRNMIVHYFFANTNTICTDLILPGYQLFYNYFRPHEASKGKTPAEVSSIVIEGENTSKTLIENAWIVDNESFQTEH